MSEREPGRSETRNPSPKPAKPQATDTKEP